MKDPTSFSLFHEDMRMVFWFNIMEVVDPKKAIDVTNKFIEDYNVMLEVNNMLTPTTYFRRNKDRYPEISHISLPNIYMAFSDDKNRLETIRQTVREVTRSISVN